MNQLEKSKAIIKLLAKNNVRVSYNDRLKNGGRSLKIYNGGASKTRIAKVKKLLASKKGVVVKHWVHEHVSYGNTGVIRIHVK